MQLNVSNNRFEFLDFMESAVKVDFTSLSPTRMVLDVWGITLPISIFGLEVYGLTEETKPFNDDIYVAGFSRLIFNDVTGVDIEVELVSKETPMFKLRWPDSSLLKLNKTWGELSPGNGNYIYEIQGTLTWPYGRCDLSVGTQSRVSIELNSANFVPLTEYTLNTRKYGWKEEVELY